MLFAWSCCVVSKTALRNPQTRAHSQSFAISFQENGGKRKAKQSLTAGGEFQTIPAMSNPLSVLDRIRKEGKVINRARWSVLVIVVLIGAAWFSGFKTVIFLQSETLRAQSGTIAAYKSKWGDLPSDTTTRQTRILFQVMVYTNDPNSDKIAPEATNSPALAYKIDGSGPMF